MQKKQTSNQNLSELADKQVIDIVHPKGARKVDETSKPIIVTNRPMVKDSMLTQSTDESTYRTTPAAHEMVVTPPESSAVSEPEADADPNPQSNASAEQTDTPPPEELADSQQSVTSGKDGDSTSDSTETVDSSETDALIEQKTYFLPINAALHRRSKRVAGIGTILIVVLLLAWFDIALDAGIIDIPALHPVTHFFGQF